MIKLPGIAKWAFAHFFLGERKRMLNRGLDKQELLRIVDSVANEKSIDKEIILTSMETAIQRAAHSKFGFENAIEASINRENGSIKIHKVLEVVDKVEDPVKEITLKDATSIDKKNKDLKVGDKIYTKNCHKLILEE